MYYTKYRPQKFSEISKPNATAEALMNQVRSDKVGHAYLFIGPRGTGKTTTARILAKALNCKEAAKDGDPCGKCDSCEAIRMGSFIDLIEIDAASNRGIDDIRDLREKVKLAPTAGKNKVYIIDEVHMLTTEAFNALLKTLEEPPSHVTFILCTTEDHKVPETIKSRCQVFKFKRATVPQIVQRLEGICKKEDVKLDKKDLKKIAQASFGGFRDAETLLQQVVEGSLDVSTFIGSVSVDTFVDFIDCIQEKDSNRAILQINSLYDDGVDIHVWITDLIRYLRDLLFISSDSYEGLIDATGEVFSKMEEQANKFDSSEIVFIIEHIMEAQFKTKGSFVPQLPLELAIVKLCNGVFEAAVKTGISGTGSGDSSGKLASKDSKAASEKKNNKKSDISKSDEQLGAELLTITNAWTEILKAAVAYNHSTQALLKSSKPKEVLGEELVLEVFYPFHKERLETPKNKKIVETVLMEVLNTQYKLKCVLGQKSQDKSSDRNGFESASVPQKTAAAELTDKNVAVPSGKKDPLASGGNILDVFDGELPL